MELCKLALDWTPNSNHIGFFVAQHKGWYQEVGIDLQVLDPAADGYATTPAKKVELGAADVALCPFESLISYRVKQDPVDLRALGTLFQEDLSAVVVLASGPVQTPKQLDGCSYASYKARYEDGIVKAMVQADGGSGNLEIIYPNKLGIWNTLLEGNATATWIFENWEGVQAAKQGIGLRSFRLKDYNIPYGYSPILATTQVQLQERSDLWQQFMEVTKKGFYAAAQDPAEAASILLKHVPVADRDVQFLEASIKSTVPALGNEASWGKMDMDRVQQFLDWLYNMQLENKPWKASDFC